jgi:hypothetical protein
VCGETGVGVGRVVRFSVMRMSVFDAWRGADSKPGEQGRGCEGCEMIGGPFGKGGARGEVV